MSRESSWNQTQVSLPPLCIPPPSVFNWENKSISFLPRALPRKEFNMIQQGLHSQNQRMFESECSTIQRSLPITRHSLGRETRTIQGLYPLANQVFVNVPNIAQNSNLLHLQISSNEIGVIKAFHPSTDRMLVNKSNVNTYLQNHQHSSEVAHMIQDFHPVAYQLSANESIISKQSCSLSHQLPTNGISMNQSSNMFNQQLPINVSQIGHLPFHVLSQSEFRRNQIKYPPDQQSGREFTTSQGLRSIFGHHSKGELGIPQNPYIPSQQNVLNRVSYPVSVISPGMGFNRYKELSDQNLYPQYLEKVEICVVGPPRCGKADLIQTFAKNDYIRISTDKPLNWVAQQGMVSFGTTLKIDIWHGEDLTSAAEDIRSLCQSSKSVIVLVYNVAQKSTLSTVLEWIEFLKRNIDFKVPTILIGNVTDVVSSCTSKEFTKMTPNLVRFMDGIRVRDEYGLSAFYECSTKCVKDVEAIFLTAALKAFHRKF